MNHKKYTIPKRSKAFKVKSEVDLRKEKELLPGIIILPIFFLVIILFIFGKEQILFSIKDSLLEFFEYFKNNNIILNNKFVKIIFILIVLMILILYKYIHYLLFISSFILFFMGLANHGNKEVEDDGDKFISFSIIFLILGGIEIKYDIIPTIIMWVSLVFSLF